MPQYCLYPCRDTRCTVSASTVGILVGSVSISLLTAFEAEGIDLDRLLCQHASPTVSEWPHTVSEWPHTVIEWQHTVSEWPHTVSEWPHSIGGVAKVGICQLLYLVSSRLRGRLDYSQSVDDVSNELRRLIGFFPRVHFWKHCSMLLNGCSLGVHWVFTRCSLLSNNGTRLNTNGDRIYFRSIRGGVVFLAKC